MAACYRNHLFQGPISEPSHTLRSWGRGLPHVHLGGTEFSPWHSQLRLLAPHSCPRGAPSFFLLWLSHRALGERLARVSPRGSGASCTDQPWGRGLEPGAAPGEVRLERGGAEQPPTPTPHSSPARVPGRGGRIRSWPWACGGAWAPPIRGWGWGRARGCGAAACVLAPSGAVPCVAEPDEAASRPVAVAVSGAGGGLFGGSWLCGPCLWGSWAVFCNIYNIFIHNSQRNWKRPRTPSAVKWKTACGTCTRGKSVQR